jgi:hypothetical protein
MGYGSMIQSDLDAGVIQHNDDNLLADSASRYDGCCSSFIVNLDGSDVSRCGQQQMR